MYPARSLTLVNGWETVRYELLNTRISDLELRIEGSPLEPCIKRLYAELAAKGLRFQPECYLTDSWGCPNEVPVMGIPFYLADKRLARIEEEQTGEIENEQWTLMLLRHEAGHAVNYAYRLYQRLDWTETFGSFSKPYRDIFRPNPFSRQYVRHIVHHQYGRTYAQKHPDEDFAETFAVWMTPRSGWKKKYRGWGAMAKLRYMDRIAREVGNVDPVRKRGRPDITVGDMEMTVAEFYHSATEQVPLLEVTQDSDLAAIFNASKKSKTAQSAAAFLQKNRKAIVDQIASWTALARPAARRLMESIEKRSAELGLLIDGKREAEHLSEITVF